MSTSQNLKEEKDYRKKEKLLFVEVSLLICIGLQRNMESARMVLRNTNILETIVDLVVCISKI